MRLKTLFFSLVCLVTASSARADSTVTITEFTDANFVMFTCTGSLNTAALSPTTVISPAGNINPDAGYILSKDTTDSAGYVATVGSTGAIDFGLDSVIPCDYFYGDNFGFTSMAYLLPDAYTSGDPITSTMVFLNQSILSLGIDEPGAPFTTTLSTGDKLTIKISDCVDESVVQALKTSSANTERLLKKKVKKLTRQLRAAKRNAR